jgi:hypothetical protein
MFGRRLTDAKTAGKREKEIGADSRGIARQHLISAVTFLTLGNR